MTQIVSLGKHPLVESEPRELAIDKACLRMEIERCDLDRLGAGAHYRSPDGAGTYRSTQSLSFAGKSVMSLRFMHVIQSDDREHELAHVIISAMLLRRYDLYSVGAG
jgi:hypothetical protein